MPMRQSVTWLALTGADDFSQPTYSESVIPCRLQARWKQIRNAQGAEVTSSAVVYTLAAVGIGDAIRHGGRDWSVLNVGDIVDLAGAFCYREVAL